MPFYEYRCCACGHELTLLQKRTAPGPGQCARCQKGEMIKCIGGCSFALSGSGWFKDGYGTIDQTASKATPATPATPASEAESL